MHDLWKTQRLFTEISDVQDMLQVLFAQRVGPWSDKIELVRGRPWEL
jgi:hypothetical protein